MPINEFVFEQTDSESGELSYRCMEFSIRSPGGFTTGQIEVLQGIVECLNEHFEHLDELADDE